ncbi:MAG: GNAT family N-acetyltransferase [Actinomycetota bacterium]|nr:GNAT family N-acetyltransferase [Actinomycetota bacterium]
MTAGPTVRDARPEEYAALATLTVAAYRALLGDALGGPYLAELADVAGRAAAAEVLVAVDAAARLLGGVTYLPSAGPLAAIGDDEAAIRYLAVAPEAQGRGVGSALVAACVDRARAGGKIRLTLHTTDPMTAAQRLYERAGFRRDPDRNVALESGLVLLAYVLELGR